ncbi:hypothetical protein WCD74_02140 [Actinomycetospora sp. OC33-EN08]|uniref:Glutamine amidotransferase domain-containing protein n=1 Tax=Actinomycetospora aurantiaca TaxID=3129233 RepID=A0ABU8MHV5_9PSEU
MKQALVIGHDHVAAIEHLGTDLERRGFSVSGFTVVPEDRFTRPDVVVTYPDPLAWDLVVTVGAPWPRHAIDGWARREVEFLARRHEHGRPTLGLCFGGQLLGEALGVATTPLPARRVGWHPVDPVVPEIRAGPWFQWHAEQLTAPAGAEVLARSPDGVEAFRADRSVALQFHPEMTPRLLRRWLTLPGGHGLDDPDSLEADTRRHADGAARAARSLLDLLG